MQIISSNLFKSRQILSTLLENVVTLHRERKKSLLGDLAKSQRRKSKTCTENKQTSKTTKNTENYE